MSEQLLNALNKYYDVFDDSFPTIPMSGHTEKEMIAIIDECISKNKDVYDLNYLYLGETY